MTGTNGILTARGVEIGDEVADIFEEAAGNVPPAIGSIVDAVSRRAVCGGRLVLDGNGPEVDSDGNFSSVLSGDEGDGRFFKHEGNS